MRRLRWRDADDPESVRRLHAQLNPLLDHPLPDASAEREDPAAADRRYDEAVAVLRERMRNTQKFRLVFAENMEYGFRRNSLGLRPIALGVAGVSLALSLALLAWGDGDLSSRSARWGVSAAISTAAVIYWWFIVTPAWVRRAAELYADRLFEAVDTVRADARSESNSTS